MSNINANVIGGNVSGKLVSYIEATKKVRTKDGEIEGLVSEIITNMNYFNTLGPYQTRLNDVELKMIPIPNEFKDMILPSSVKYDQNDISCRELLEVQKQNVPFSLEKWLQILAKYRGLYKSDALENVSYLADLKKAVNLADVIQRLSIRIDDVYKCHAIDGKPYFPFVLSDELLVKRIFRDAYFNVDRSEMEHDYLLGLYTKN